MENILREAKRYLEQEHKDNKEVLKRHAAFTDEKITKLLLLHKAKDYTDKHDIEDVVCDIFENVLYRPTKEELKILFKS